MRINSTVFLGPLKSLVSPLVLCLLLISFCPRLSAADSLANNPCDDPQAQQTISVVDSVRKTIEKHAQSTEDHNSLVSAVYTEARKQRVESFYAEIKQIARERLLTSAAQPILAKFDQSKILDNAEEASVLNQVFTDRLANIQLGGWLELIDEAPEAVFALLAHEAGHVVGPTQTFLFELEKQRSRIDVLPYTRDYALDFLVEKAAQRSRGQDFSCLLDRAKEMMDGPPYYRQHGVYLDQAVRDMQLKNPFVSLDYFSYARTSCLPSQIEETFADAFAIEILREKVKRDSSFSLFTALSFYCSVEAQEKISGHPEPDPHPPMFNRLEFYSSSLK